MALTFPIAYEDFVGMIGLSEGTFTLARNDQVSGMGNSQPLNAELASPLWLFEGVTIPFPNEDAEAIAAIFELLEGPGRDFYVANPRKIGPRADRDGSILGSATPVINSLDANNRELAIDSLPPDYVLSRGDMMAFDYGPSEARRRALHRVISTITASGSGLTGLIEVYPHIRTGAAEGDPIYLAPPTMRAKLVPKSYRPRQEGALHQRFTFSAIQKLI